MRCSITCCLSPTQRVLSIHPVLNLVSTGRPKHRVDSKKHKVVGTRVAEAVLEISDQDRKSPITFAATMRFGLSTIGGYCEVIA
jgi:hypothetical protein